MARAHRALSGDAQGNYVSFASHELMLKTTTAKRWELVKSMAPRMEGLPSRSMRSMWILSFGRLEE
jgi:hypothetical protein